MLEVWRVQVRFIIISILGSKSLRFGVFGLVHGLLQTLAII